MKYDINKTAIVPYIIAERAIWNVIEEDKRYNDMPPDAINDLMHQIGPTLTSKAETLYNTSKHFRSAINNKRTDMRYMLEMFMEHWTKAILKSKK